MFVVVVVVVVVVVAILARYTLSFFVLYRLLISETKLSCFLTHTGNNGKR